MLHAFLAMADDQALHRCVTEFMLDTCCFDTKTNYNALFSCLIRSLVMAADDCEALSSGSSAEFYIHPMLRSVGDIDIMSCFNNCLAIPAGHRPPTELPARFERTVNVYEIIDSHQPGFVYLMLSCILTKNESNTYVEGKSLTSKDTPRFLPKPDIQATAEVIAQKIRTFSHFPNHLKQCVHGPAVETGVMGTVIEAASGYYRHRFVADMERREGHWYYDYVLSMRCQCWPPQAANWPTRLRKHGVPERKIVNIVVSNGCDLVGAVHPRCRQDDWMNKHQWRLSFSRAEVTLLNSWTPVQQIVYHMLRYVLKRGFLSKTDDKYQDLPKLSNYHIKTLMLWECEQKPQSWWSAESSLIKLCSSLISKLSDWIEDEHCEHYFISNCNLLDHFQGACLTISYSLKCLADSSVLLFWFVDNYIRECAQRCPREVSALFENIRSNDSLERAIHAVVDWKLNSILLSHACNWCEWLLLYHFQEFHEVAKLTQSRVKELQDFDPRYRDYLVAVTSLHIAYTVSIHFLTEDLLEELWILFNPINAAGDGTATSRHETGGLLCIRKAMKLATLSSVRSTALEMLHDEMSKAYLHHSFVYGQESVYCVVHVLLATLYYKSRQSQTAIDHCKQVLTQCHCDQYGSNCLGADCLPQIDENVDVVTGLILLYQYIRRFAMISDKKQQLDDRQSYSIRGSESASHEMRGKLIWRGSKVEVPQQEPRFSCPKSAAEPNNLRLPAFTTHSLAHYLYLRCSAAVTTKVRIVKFCQQQLSQTKNSLLGDVLLFRLMKMQLDDCTETAVSEDEPHDDGNDVSSSMDNTRLITTLELVALENLIRARQVNVIREMHCKHTRHVNEFEALYAYKRGLFKECMKICRRDIEILRSDVCIQHHPVAYPEMLSLLDGELVSIFGIIRLLRPNFIFALAYNSRLYEQIHMPTLFLYLIVCCQRNLRSNLLDNTMNLMRHLHDKIYPANRHFFLDRLILRLTYRSLILHSKTRSI